MVESSQMKFSFSTKKEIDPKKLNELFNSIGWKHRTPAVWRRCLKSSSFVISAWEDESLVGLGRILEDGVMCMFYDLGVLPKYQNKGVGTKLMETLINRVKDKKYTSIGLFTWDKNPPLKKYYKRFGFEEVNTGMELVKYMHRD